MDDIVERLHNVEGYLRFANRASVHADNVIEAADAIESLRAENARLTEERDALATGLRGIAEYPYRYGQHVQRLKVIAARTLAKVKGGPDAR